MNQYAMKPVEQLELLEGSVEMKKLPAKRVNIVSLKLVKESSLLYKDRCVRSPEDGYQLLKQFLGEADREYYVVGNTADFKLTGPNGQVTTLTGQATNSDLTIAGLTFDFGTDNVTQNGVLNFTLSPNGLEIDLSGAATVNTSAIAAYKGEKLNIGGFEFTIKTNHGSNGATLVGTLQDKSIKFHIGANQDQNTSLSINNMSATALGINNIDVTSQSGANVAITTLDDAIKKVSTERSKLGAIQNRLEHIINNLGTSAENLTAAESRIRDVDMAKEMMEFTKNNILSQAAQAMLAQANQQPQGVLQLLR